MPHHCQQPNKTDDVVMQSDATAGTIYCLDCTDFSGALPANLHCTHKCRAPIFTSHKFALTLPHTTLTLCRWLHGTHDVAAQIEILASNTRQLPTTSTRQHKTGTAHNRRSNSTHEHTLLHAWQPKDVNLARRSMPFIRGWSAGEGPSQRHWYQSGTNPVKVGHGDVGDYVVLSGVCQVVSKVLLHTTKNSSREAGAPSGGRTPPSPGECPPAVSKHAARNF
jgi:hypothetical protein